MSDAPDIELKMTLDSKALNSGLDASTQKVAQSADKMAASMSKVNASAEKAQKTFGSFNASGISSAVTSLAGLATYAVGSRLSQSANENDRLAGGAISGMGMGATVGTQIASLINPALAPLGALAGAAAGAALGLDKAAGVLVAEAEARLKSYEQNLENNSAKVRMFKRGEARDDEAESFADKMGDSGLSYSQKIAMLDAREAEMQATKDRAAAALKKNPILESNEGTATALSMYTESKAELKKMAEMRKKLSGGDAKGDGISHGNYASNALTKMGGGINGLMGFDSAQKETNTLLKKSNAILEKISSKAGSTTATWGK